MFYWNTAIPVGLCLVQSCIHPQSSVVKYLDRDHEDDKAWSMYSLTLDSKKFANPSYKPLNWIFLCNSLMGCWDSGAKWADNCSSIWAAWFPKNYFPTGIIFKMTNWSEIPQGIRGSMHSTIWLNKNMYSPPGVHHVLWKCQSLPSQPQGVSFIGVQSGVQSIRVMDE